MILQMERLQESVERCLEHSKCAGEVVREIATSLWEPKGVPDSEGLVPGRVGESS